MNWLNTLYRFLASEDGPAAVEYATMLFLICLACLGGIVLLGEATSTSFESSQSSIQSALTP